MTWSTYPDIIKSQSCAIRHIKVPWVTAKVCMKPVLMYMKTTFKILQYQFRSVWNNKM